MLITQFMPLYALDPRCTYTLVLLTPEPGARSRLPLRLIWSILNFSSLCSLSSLLSFAFGLGLQPTHSLFIPYLIHTVALDTDVGALL